MLCLARQLHLLLLHAPAHLLRLLLLAVQPLLLQLQLHLVAAQGLKLLWFALQLHLLGHLMLHAPAHLLRLLLLAVQPLVHLLLQRHLCTVAAQGQQLPRFALQLRLPVHVLL